MFDGKVKGQPFMDRYQYRQVCGGCGVVGLWVDDQPTMPARVRHECPACKQREWAYITALPEGFRR